MKKTNIHKLCTAAFLTALALVGTSVLGAMCAFPIASFIMGNKEATLFGFIVPFFISCVVGTVAAAVVVTTMKRTRVLDKFFIEDPKKAGVK